MEADTVKASYLAGLPFQAEIGRSLAHDGHYWTTIS